MLTDLRKQFKMSILFSPHLHKTCNTLCKYSIPIKKFSSNQQCSEIRQYRYFLPLQTRWSDNDQYGHINNAVYYQYFDTVLSSYLLSFTQIALETPEEGARMVNTNCTYKSPCKYPDILLGALAVEKIGRSSVHYKVGIFKSQKYIFSLKDYCEEPFTICGVGLRGLHVEEPNADEYYKKLECCFDDKVAAFGKPIHVFVNNKTGKPISEFSPSLLATFQKLKSF